MFFDLQNQFSLITTIKKKDLNSWQKCLRYETNYQIVVLYDLGQDFIGKYSRMHNLNFFDGGERGSTRQCG